jgi:DNA-binding transcriptional ArsR family regulator
VGSGVNTRLGSLVAAKTAPLGGVGQGALAVLRGHGSAHLDIRFREYAVVATPPGGRMSQALRTPESIPRDELYALHASFCQALSDPKRLLIVSALRAGEKSVGELCQLVGARQSNVSQHLALMRHLGLVETRRAEGNILYRLADPRIAEAVELLRAVQTDLQRRRTAALDVAI